MNGFYLPQLQICLFSPKIYFKQEDQKGGKYILEWDKSYLDLIDGD
jgi:hypothetical protein